VSNRPSGTVTFLFTDIEGSTKLARENSENWNAMQEKHHGILQNAMDSNHGYVFQIVGDAFCVSFHNVKDALKAGADAQKDLYAENWGISQVKVRMGIHTGSAELKSNGEYQGYLSLSHVQRLMSAGHGGQVLISSISQGLINDDLPSGLHLRDLGEKQLNDILQKEHIYQLIIPDLPNDFPEIRSIDPYRHNLPAHLTSFIGREKEIEEIKQELSNHRLVTLTGSGGTGKSRLSVQVAADLLDNFTDGTWFIELAPLSDPNLIAQTIQSTMGLIEQKDVSAFDALQEYLKEKKVLLVLDNCEHMIRACADVSNALLSNSTNLKILASSREALGVHGELSWRVPSLSLPDEKNIPEPDELTQYEAVRLFIERAELVNPKFKVNKENAPAIAQICFRLDGIPLALELAAARLKALSAEQINARLDDRFKLLTGGSRTALPRQQTLRAMIDWSYNLLSEEEKTLFRRLAVFVGGWSLEGAEAVCSGDGIEKDEILDLMTNLVDKSLVNTNEFQGEVRYSRLETIRQYGREKFLDTDEVEKLRDRHLNYYVDLAEKAEPEIRSHNQVYWLDRFETEVDNIRSALEWAENRNDESFLRLASDTSRFWDIRGGFEEGITWLTQALKANEDLKSKIRSTALARITTIYVNHYGLKEAASVALSALTVGKNTNDIFSTSYAYCIRGALESSQANDQQAADHFHEALLSARSINDHWLLAFILVFKGLFLDTKKDMRLAEATIREGLHEARVSGDKRLISFCLSRLALLQTVQFKETHQARELIHEALSLAEEINSQNNIIYSYIQLSDADLFDEDFPSAEANANIALKLANKFNAWLENFNGLRQLAFIYWSTNRTDLFFETAQELVKITKHQGLLSQVAESMYLPAFAYIEKGDLKNARAVAAEAIHLSNESNTPSGLLNSLQICMVLSTIEKKYEQAAIFSGITERLSSTLPVYQYPVEERILESKIKETKKHLGAKAFKLANEKGQATTKEEAIKYALEFLNE